MNLKRRRILLLASALFCLLGGVFVTGLVVSRFQKTEPPPSAIGGPFSLVASNGEAVTERDLLGKWTLIYFGYTFCPDACPTALSDMSVAMQKLGATAARIQPIFITVDPKRDTQPVLTAYLMSFDPRIEGLTGSVTQTAAAAAAYHVYVQPHEDGTEDYLVDHSAYIYVMDPQGRFVDVVDGATPGDQLADSVQKMMNRYL